MNPPNEDCSADTALKGTDLMEQHLLLKPQEVLLLASHYFEMFSSILAPGPLSV